MDIPSRLASIFPRPEQIPAAMRIQEPLIQREYLVNGQLEQWTGPMQDVYSPICIQTQNAAEPFFLGQCPRLDGDAALRVLDAAVRAYNNGRGVWPTMSVAERISCVENFVFRMSQKREEVVRLLMWEICKNSGDAAGEFDRTIKYIKDTIDALKELDRNSSRFVIDSGIIAQIRRAPLGTVLCMGPFNYPLNETFTTLIPALIMGNTVLFKPAKCGVLLLRPLLDAFRDSFPPGVINTLYGSGRDITPPLMRSGKVDCLAFIGSTEAADALKLQHPKPHRLRCALGMAAKNPAIVLPDADLDLSAEECSLGALSFNGQRCTGLKIIFVHQSIADEFLAKLCARISALPIGMPWEDGVKLTPLPEDGKAERMAAYVQDAVRHGAKVVNEHGGSANKTVFFPAVVYPVHEPMRLFSEEQFGPVVAVTPFTAISEPVDYIVNSRYGQQASIFGKDPEQIARLVDPLVNQVCRLNLNSQCQRGPDTFPFTGRKDSAEGTLSVSDALRVFSIRTLVAAKLNNTNKGIINGIVHDRRSKFLSDDFLI